MILISATMITMKQARLKTIQIFTASSKNLQPYALNSAKATSDPQKATNIEGVLGSECPRLADNTLSLRQPIPSDGFLHMFKRNLDKQWARDRCIRIQQTAKTFPSPPKVARREIIPRFSPAATGSNTVGCVTGFDFFLCFFWRLVRFDMVEGHICYAQRLIQTTTRN
ncbi:MAG: hypothetical protein R3F19_16815 [Verrucomicrobiales bacterium]